MTDQPPIVSDERENLPSASSFDRLWHCPGSRAAEQGLAELPKDDTTEEGTQIHDALHSGDDSELALTPKQIAKKLGDMELSALEKWTYDFGLPGGQCSTIREQRLWLRNPATLELVASAKPDVVRVVSNTAMVTDFKSGFLDTTPSERNWQLRVQAVCVYQEFRVVHVRAAIAQSRLSSKFDSVDFDADDLRRVEREIIHAVWRSEQSDAPRTPGSHCRWCRANGVCREKAVYDQISSAQLPVVSKGKPDQLAIIEVVDRLTPQEIGFLYRRKSSLEIAYDAMEHRMKQMPAETLESIGYKLADGSKLKDIVDVPTAFARLGGLLTNEERMQVIKITRGKAAELLADRTNISKKEAQGQVDEAMGDAVIEREGNKRLRAL